MLPPLTQAGGFREAAEDVHALHGLAAGALGQIVQGAEDEEPAGARIQTPGDFDDVGAGDVFGVGQGLAIEEADERFVRRRRPGSRRRFAVPAPPFRLRRRRAFAGVKYSVVRMPRLTGIEMRRELDDDRRPRRRRSIAPRFPTDAGGAARRKGARFRCIRQRDNPFPALRPAPLTPLRESAMMLSCLTKPGLQQRDERQQNAGGITARRGDEGGVLDLRAVDFGQAIDRLFEQLGRGMVVPVKFLVSGGVLEPEIGAQINDLATQIEQGRGKFRRDAVRQGQENDLRPALASSSALGSLKRRVLARG